MFAHGQALQPFGERHPGDSGADEETEHEGAWYDGRNRWVGFVLKIHLGCLQMGHFAPNKEECVLALLSLSSNPKKATSHLSLFHVLFLWVGRRLVARLFTWSEVRRPVGREDRCGRESFTGAVALGRNVTI